MLMQDRNREITVSLNNLSVVRSKLYNLRRGLAEAVESNILIGQENMDAVSSEISDAIHQIIINGAALVASTSGYQQLEHFGKFPDIVEPDAQKLLTECPHLCEICGKGFKRDATLRMHIRGHGSESKILEELRNSDYGKAARYSCPMRGCNRNMRHKKFLPFNSFVGVRNHFKRCHSPKTYRCDRCNLKSFSAVGELKNHMKLCKERSWECSCSSTFASKYELFRHLTICDGHFPSSSTTAVDGASKGKKIMEDDDYGFNELIKQTADNYGLLYSYGNAATHGLQDCSF